MVRHEHEAVASRVAIAGHPIHPMLVHFPIAGFLGTLLTDIAWLATGREFWAEASWWLLSVALITGILAGIVGGIDYLSIGRIRRLKAGQLHAVGNIVALGLAVWNLALRVDDVTGIEGTAFVLSLVTAALLGLTAWFGGELAFRHRIGVVPNAQGSDHRS